MLDEWQSQKLSSDWEQKYTLQALVQKIRQFVSGIEKCRHCRFVRLEAQLLDCERMVGH